MARLRWLIPCAGQWGNCFMSIVSFHPPNNPIIIPVLWMKTPRYREIGLWILEAQSHALWRKQKGPPGKSSILKDRTTFHVYLFKRKVKQCPLISKKKMRRNTFKDLYWDVFLNGDSICLLLMYSEWPQKRWFESTHSYYVTAPRERKPGGFAQRIKVSKSRRFQIGFW